MVGTGKDTQTQTTQAQTHTNDYGGPTISGFLKKIMEGGLSQILVQFEKNQVNTYAITKKYLIKCLK